MASLLSNIQERAGGALDGSDLALIEDDAGSPLDVNHLLDRPHRLALRIGVQVVTAGCLPRTEWIEASGSPATLAGLDSRPLEAFLGAAWARLDPDERLVPRLSAGSVVHLAPMARVEIQGVNQDRSGVRVVEAPADATIRSLKQAAGLEDGCGLFVIGQEDVEVPDEAFVADLCTDGPHPAYSGLMQARPFKVDDRVRCRDDGDDWKEGRVTELDPLMVLVEGFPQACGWFAVEHVQEAFDARLIAACPEDHVRIQVRICDDPGSAYTCEARRCCVRVSAQCCSSQLVEALQEVWCVRNDYDVYMHDARGNVFDVPDDETIAEIYEAMGGALFSFQPSSKQVCAPRAGRWVRFDASVAGSSPPGGTTVRFICRGDASLTSALRSVRLGMGWPTLIHSHTELAAPGNFHVDWSTTAEEVSEDWAGEELTCTLRILDADWQVVLRGRAIESSSDAFDVPGLASCQRPESTVTQDETQQAAGSVDPDPVPLAPAAASPPVEGGSP